MSRAVCYSIAPCGDCDGCRAIAAMPPWEPETAAGWRVWRAPGRREPFPMGETFGTFDTAADAGAELESAAGARGDVLHLFVAPAIGGVS